MPAPGSKDNGGKPFAGISRPTTLAIGVDGSLCPNLMCWYCKDTRHELEYCRQLKQKFPHECMTTSGIMAKESTSENTDHP